MVLKEAEREIAEELPEVSRGWPLRDGQLTTGNAHVGWSNYLEEVRVEAENAVHRAETALNEGDGWDSKGLGTPPGPGPDQGRPLPGRGRPLQRRHGQQPLNQQDREERQENMRAREEAATADAGTGRDPGNHADAGMDRDPGNHARGLPSLPPHMTTGTPPPPEERSSTRNFNPTTTAATSCSKQERKSPTARCNRSSITGNKRAIGSTPSSPRPTSGDS